MRTVFIRISILVALVTVSLLRPSFAQEAPMKWGEIPKEDLAMKAWPLDTNASAVYLCDYGHIEFTNDLTVNFKKHTRIKIFSEKGYRLGTVEIQLFSKDQAEKIKNIEGVTYLPNADGTVTKKELAASDIFKEKLDDKMTNIKFTLPGLKAGCIIEFRFEIEYQNWFIFPTWDFQKSEPVRWSEYVAVIPRNFNYAAQVHSYYKFSIHESTPVKRSFLGEAAFSMGLAPVDCAQLRYVLENVPALKDEPYITTLEDYRNWVRMQIVEYRFGERYHEKVMDTWPEFIKKLLKHPEFGKKLDNTRAMRAVVDKITAGMSQPEEKLVAIHDWIAKTIVTTHENDIWVVQDVNDILESKKADGPEIAILLTSMLRYAGIKCDPVILSTRSNGAIQKMFPMAEQFNHVMSIARIGTKEYFLEPTSPYRPYDILPTDILGVSALVLQPDTVEWVTIPSTKKEIKSSSAVINLHPDASIDGQLTDVFKQYAALFNRSKLENGKQSDVVKNIFDAGENGFQLDSITVTGLDTTSMQIIVDAKVSSSSYAQAAGDMIYLNPHIINRLRENPFKSERRDFPIDFGYRRDEVNSTVVVVPDSFEIKDKLPDRIISCVDGDLTFSRQMQISDNRMQVLYKLSVKTPMVGPEYYSMVRDFFNKIVALESEQIVLTPKKPAAATSPDTQETPKGEGASATETKDSQTKNK